MRCVIGLALLCGMATHANAASLSVPLSEWTEGRTLEVVRGSKPPFGTWSEKDGKLLARGAAACWSTRLLPGNQGSSSEVSVRFAVKESSKAAFRIAPGSRWGYHWGENEPGWDFGVVLRWTDALNFYRVQLSASRGELALWDSTGGFLQWVDCPVKLGQAHTLKVVQHAARFQVTLDGKPVLTYYDRAVPHVDGQVGLSVWKSTVQVDRFDAGRATAQPTPLPDHKPDLALKPFGRSVLVMDGHEPITQFWTFHRDKRAILKMSHVKLMPGWRSVYGTWIGPRVWPGSQYGVLPLAAREGGMGKLPDAFKTVRQGEQLVVTFTNAEPNVATVPIRMTVDYDAKHGVYRYEFEADVTFTGGPEQKLKCLELFDPLTYNNRSPGPEVVHRWHGAGHKWMLYQGPGNRWERFPLIDFLGGFSNQPSRWSKNTSLLYPDPVVCPVFQTELGWKQPEKRRNLIGLCHWGYDFHHKIEGPVDVTSKTKRPYRFVFTGMRPEQAKPLYEKSVVGIKVAESKDVFAVFEPAGCTFTKTISRQDPKGETMPWYGGVVDTSVGRKDRGSLRIDGPDQTRVQIYQHAIETKAKQWWVRGWVKSKDVVGRGLQMRVKYSYDAEPMQLFYIGARGTCDWTYFSFLTDAFKRPDSSELLFELDASGQIWLDDVAVSAVTDGKTPKVTLVPEPTGMTPSRELMIDLPLTTKPGKGVYDASQNGHHLLLDGPTWMQEQGRGFLRFDGKDDLGRIPVKEPLAPLKFRANDTWFPLKAFSYELWARVRDDGEKKLTLQSLFHHRRNPYMRVRWRKGKWILLYTNNRHQGEQISMQADIQANQWLHIVVTHGNGKVILYVNGKPAGEATYGDKSRGFTFACYTKQYHVGCFYSGHPWFRGDIGPFRLHTKALSPKEVSERLRSSWPARSGE